jgi:phage-related protein
VTSFNAPESHLVEGQKLEADGEVLLFEIQLVSGSVIRLKANDDVTYLGHLYEGMAIQLGGDGQSADSELNRPKLTIVNPEGAFSPAIDRGDLNKATVIRRRVLYADLIANRSVYQESSWTLSRVVALNKQGASFELRGTGDQQFFVIPARQFVPPEFSQVSLS